MPIKPNKISNVVGENRSLLANSEFKLFSIGFTSALQVQDVDRIVAPLTKNLGKQRPNIFVEQQADLNHQLAASGDESVELSRSSLSIDSLWS